LSGNCEHCYWHDHEHKHSFGPFSSKEALAVILDLCVRWAKPEVVGKYIKGQTTNYNEYTNSLEGLFNLKIKHCKTKESYDLIAIYSSIFSMVGPKLMNSL